MGSSVLCVFCLVCWRRDSAAADRTARRLLHPAPWLQSDPCQFLWDGTVWIQCGFLRQLAREACPQRGDKIRLDRDTQHLKPSSSSSSYCLKMLTDDVGFMCNVFIKNQQVKREMTKFNKHQFYLWLIFCKCVDIHLLIYILFSSFLICANPIFHKSTDR